MPPTARPFGIHPGVARGKTQIEGMAAKTGRSAEAWAEHLCANGPEERKAQIRWLKQECGLGGNYAELVALVAAGEGAERYDEEAYLSAAAGYVDALYAGKREPLRSLYQQLLERGYRLGEDVRACPCKTFVPLYRRHVFAQIKPTTLTRIDLGLALGDTPPTGRLLSTGGLEKGDRITHRIEVRTAADVDAELSEWLRRAYEADG